MYTHFFNLKHPPFSIAPDPRHLFMSERHREALAHLLYGVNSGGGILLLTGEIGAGKTTVCRCFLEQVPANCNVAYIFNPKLTVNELLQSICDEFRIEVKHAGTAPATVKTYIDTLTAYLLAAHADGRNNVLVIDEAQNLSADVLEQLRLLTNLETNERKLLQIILIGQPELRTMLARPDLEQLAQRVIARYHLEALSFAETISYILHRLSVAGTTSVPPFRPKVIRQIHRITRGVPRRINLLCDRALLGAYVEGKHEVDSAIVRKAAIEVFGSGNLPLSAVATRWRYAAIAITAGAVLIGATAWTMNNGWHMKTAPVAETASLQTAPASAFPWDLDDPSNAGLRERSDAIREMAQLWGVSVTDNPPCLALPQQNLHCYIGTGATLAELRQLNRPAVLTLHDDSDAIYYALLTGFGQGNATLRMGGATRTMSLNDLAHHFRGGIATLWRAPYGYREFVGPGDQGEEADWIAAQLAKLHGAAQPVAKQIFDAKIARQVREFQLGQGMKPDGVVGPKTFMRLNRVAGIAEPLLRKRAAGTNATREE